MYEDDERLKGREFFTNTSWHNHDHERSLAFVDNTFGFHNKPQDLLLFDNFGGEKIVSIEDFLVAAEEYPQVAMHDDGFLTIDIMSANDWRNLFDACPGKPKKHDRFIAPFENLNLDGAVQYPLDGVCSKILAPLHLKRSIYFNYKDPVYIFRNEGMFGDGGIVGYGLIASHEYTDLSEDYSEMVTYINIRMRGFHEYYFENLISTSELKELFPEFKWDNISNLKKLPSKIAKAIDAILIERIGDNIY